MLNPLKASKSACCITFRKTNCKPRVPTWLGTASFTFSAARGAAPAQALLCPYGMALGFWATWFLSVKMMFLISLVLGMPYSWRLWYQAAYNKGILGIKPSSQAAFKALGSEGNMIKPQFWFLASCLKSNLSFVNVFMLTKDMLTLIFIIFFKCTVLFLRALAAACRISEFLFGAGVFDFAVLCCLLCAVLAPAWCLNNALQLGGMVWYSPPYPRGINVAGRAFFQRALWCVCMWGHVYC